MHDGSGNELKQRLLALIAEAREEQLVFLQGLSPRERAAVGSPDNWSAKDLIGHIGAWWERQGSRFAQVACGDQPDTFDWSDGENAETFATNQSRPWEAVVDDVASAYATLREAV